MKFKGSKQAGFSLVELMVVVGIIGILAALAVPRLQTFSAKAKVSEGKVLVNNIQTLEQAWFAENSVYSTDIAAIGFSRPGAVTGTVAGPNFYLNPVVAIDGTAVNFVVSTASRLPLCSGVPAASPLANVLGDQNGAIRYGVAAPAATAAGVSGTGTASPTFTCN